MSTAYLDDLSREIGLDLAGRTGGAGSLAVGMTFIFRAIPWFKEIAGFSLQFVILFEAVFILTAIDAGTRVACYLI
jgi:carbon starvation protein